MRWQVELLFKELKQVYRLDQMPIKKRVVVEALNYATMVTLIASQQLMAALRRQWARVAQRMPELRWAAVFQSIASDLLFIMIRPRSEWEALLKRIETTLINEAVDPHRERKTLLQAVEAG